jgi:recombination protein RecA
MDKRKRGILYGLALGDGGIYLAKDQSSDTARLVIGHGPKQTEYLQYKQRLIHSVLGGKEPSFYTYSSLNKTTGKVYVNHQVYKNHEYFRQMHRVMYPLGTKVYTEKLLSYLTDESLALWFMDDGSGTVCRNNKTKNPCGCMTRLSTYCSQEEALLLQNWFSEKYLITPKFDIDKRNDKYSLRFNTAESRVFASIVYPYMFQPMKYKLNHVNIYSPRVQDTPRGEDIVRTSAKSEGK